MDTNLMEFATYIVEKIRRSKYELIKSTVTKETDSKVVIKLVNFTTDLEITIKSKDFGPIHR